jgi:ABC-type lipoprotein release transport system permease subunit
MGSRITGVEMTGVNPETEQAALRTVRNIVSGRYLERGELGKAVVGMEVADRLHVEVGDELFATIVDVDGELKASMLTIVGISETGSEEIDSNICHVSLGDLEGIWGAEGAGEIAILLGDISRIEEVKESLGPELSGRNALLKWSEVAPELKSVYEMKAGYGSTMIGVLLLVVFLGIASAQLAAVLERRHEFAVFSALGMKAHQTALLIVYEALALGCAGAVVGLALGSPIVYLLATKGLDLRMFVGGEQTVLGGVLFDPIIHAHMGPWMVTQTLFVAITATLLGSLYPAWYAIRTDPAKALMAD